MHVSAALEIRMNVRISALLVLNVASKMRHHVERGVARVMLLNEAVLSEIVVSF